MSTVSRLNGLRPVKMVTGAPYSGAANMYFVPASDATVIMRGDLVKLLGDARSPTGVATVTRCAAGDTPIGVVVGIIFTGEGDIQNVPPVNDLNTPVYRRTLTDRYLLVADDPQLVFEVQTSVAVTTADIGLNANYRATAGSTTSGASGFDVDMATKATTNTLPLKIFGFPYRPDNNIGDAFTSVYVLLNAHTYRTGAGLSVGT